MKIIIPKTCHENWDAMALDEKGRFCQVCSKTVQDFTNLSDEELLSSFNSDQKICGRFRDDQLERNLIFSITGRIALGLFTAAGILTTVNAQEIKREEVKITDQVGGLKMTPIIKDSINKTIRLGMPSSKQNLKPLILLDGKKISVTEMEALYPDDVKSLKILSGEGAIKLYGKEGENGVILIEGKKKRSKGRIVK